MKKAIALLVLLLVACAPMSFAATEAAAADGVCTWAGSDSYPTAFAGKLIRGLANTAFGWVELFHQPMINENKWEGVSKGVVHAFGRTIYGAVEAVTSILPNVQVPIQNPPCPLEMVSQSK